MKTAEEWAEAEVKCFREVGNNKLADVAKKELIPVYKQIQLDAMKEGMRRVAKMMANEPCWSCDVIEASEQLTEKDL